MTNPPAADQTSFGHLVLEFEICLSFGACSLGFYRLHYSTTPADSLKTGKTIETPSGGSPKPGSPNSLLKPVVGFISHLTHESKLTTTVLTNMDTTQELHLGIGRIFQRNQIFWNINGYSTLLTHAFHFLTHTTTSATIVTSNPQF